MADLPNTAPSRQNKPDEDSASGKGGNRPRFDCVIDFVAPRNRNIRFFPAGKNFRGECRLDQCVGNTPAALLQVGGVIPGQRMLIDSKARYVKVIDRMNLRENQLIDRELRRLTRTEKYWNFEFGHYEDDQEYHLSENDFRTWLWHLKRIVDHGRGKVVQGTFPVENYDDILKSGRVQLGDPMGLVPIDKDRPFYMADKRDVENKELIGLGA